MEKFKPETPDLKIEKGLENQAFVENENSKSLLNKEETWEQKENIDPDFGIQEGERPDNKKHLMKSIEKYLGQKKENEKKSALRKFLGI